MLKKLTLRDLQLNGLNILVEVASFCKKNDIRYYLSGGTLLGAVRHEGFIPWDDDIDICMPRPDYEKFVRTFQSDEGLEVSSYSLQNFDAPYAKVYDKSIKIKAKYDRKPTYLWIDIMPVDGLPDSLDETKKIYKMVEQYRKIYFWLTKKIGNERNILRTYIKYIFKPLVKIYGYKRAVNNIEKVAQAIPYNDAKYVGAITWGLYGIGERMKKSEFEKSVSVKFENHTFTTFSCWDSYLTNLYGDYMVVPPPEKRKTHDVEAYLCDED